MTKPGFIPELPLSLTERLSEDVRQRCLPGDLQRWLASALLDSGCLPNDEDAFEVLRHLCLDAFPSNKVPDDRNVATFALLTGAQRYVSRECPLYPESSRRKTWSVPESAIGKFSQACLREGVDFTAGFLGQVRSDRDAAQTRMMHLHRAGELVRFLQTYGLFDATPYIDLNQLETRTRFTDWSMGSLNADDLKQLEIECSDPASPLFWMVVAPEAFEQHVAAHLPDLDDLSACRLTHALVGVTRRLMAPFTYVYPYQYALRLHQLCFDHLGGRLGSNIRSAPELLRRMWLRLAVLPHRAEVTSLAKEVQERLRAAADMEWGQLRAHLKHGERSMTTEHFQQQIPVLEAAAEILFQTGSLWDGMRPILLALHELRHLAVASDMRYWSDSWHREDAPSPWNWIPETVVSLFHVFVRREQERDPDLMDLRSQFCAFCLERLKSRKGTESPIELDDRWRWAYVRCARELRVNPQGRGHHILHHAMKNDPDDAVREESREAYAEMRHGPTLPRGLSPRRTITNSLVWLFQAHYLTLASADMPIDANGVQRTREEMARRTAEPIRSSTETTATHT